MQRSTLHLEKEHYDYIMHCHQRTQRQLTVGMWVSQNKREHVYQGT